MHASEAVPNHRRPRSVWVGWALLLLAGCADNVCGSHQDCPGGQCINGRCVASSTSERVTDGGERPLQPDVPVVDIPAPTDAGSVPEVETADDAAPSVEACADVACPSLEGYVAACNAEQYCEYRKAQQPNDWHPDVVWIYVPPGPVAVGAPPELIGAAGHGPVVQLTVAAGYFFGKTEVTVRTYEACVAAGACTPALGDGRTAQGWGLSTSANGRADHPANCLRKAQAESVCGWLHAGGQLPAESQWVRAAQGDSGLRQWPWGAMPSAACGNDVAVINIGGGPKGSGYGCASGGTFPVGSKPLGASAIGALDMAGNVAEFMADCIHLTLDDIPKDGTAWTTDCEDDPDFPGVTTRGLSKGGSLATAGIQIQVAHRSIDTTDSGVASMGARCVIPGP